MLALDGGDRVCLALTAAVVLTILGVLVTDPGDGMKRARQKVEARRAAAAAAAARPGADRIGTRSHGKRPSWLQRHVGDVCLVLVGGAAALRHLAAPSWLPDPWLSGDAGGQSQLLATVPAGWIHREEPGGRVVASDGRAVDGSVPLYSPSLMSADPTSGQRDDLLFVCHWVLALTAVRSLVFRLLLLPIARAARVDGEMDQHKFAESTWQVLWYSFAFCKGLQLMGGSPFWFGSLGGADDWVSPTCNAQFRPRKVV